jgi:hypothetical protein
MLTSAIDDMHLTNDPHVYGQMPLTGIWADDEVSSDAMGAHCAFTFHY